MYYDYFGLKQPPFRITPDTSLFYPGGNRGPILEALVYAILNGEGIVKVVGEVGSGKTMLCRMLQQELPGHVEIVYLANPSLSPENILHVIAFELKLPVKAETSRLEVMQALQNYLLERHAQNRQVVVFVEEAQGMPLATLEQIRLLSNLETQQHKLLQIVLFGQPELDERIGRPDIRQLKERITYSFELGPFNGGDIRDYVNSRMRACGYRAGEVFSDGAIRAIRLYSRGLARRVNILADKSLLAAFADHTHAVGVRHVRRAARDSDFASSWRKYLPAILGAVVVLVLLAGVLWLSARGANGNAPGAPLAGAPDRTPALDSSKGKPAGAVSPEHEAAAAAAVGNAVSPASAGVIQGQVAARETQASATPAMPAPKPETAAVGEPVDPSEDTGKAAAPPVHDAPVAEPADSPGTTASAASPAGEAAPLLGIGPGLGVQEEAGPGMSAADAAMLEKQLAALPAEEDGLGGPSPPGDTCDICWTFIYRPMGKPENL